MTDDVNASPHQRLRVFIVDDHALFAQGLSLLLSANASDRIEVVGLATHPAEAVSEVINAGTDVALVDLAMPPLGGVDVIRAIKQRKAQVKIIALTGSEDLELGEAAIRAGADAYLTKSSDPDALLAPILSVAGGLCVLRPEMVAALLSTPRKPPEFLLAKLSQQELRLWSFVAQGLETGDIAHRLLVSERTAKRMVAGLLHKIGAANRIEAAGLAGWYGLLHPGEQ
ncbi:response regulator transcription factor [Amycolatopsis sp. K13G38]|uniref:Response regulator transcription factor n=1 Tax=Amycolatopsis acididurans TaxID=2724524 RepID=A0ABX1JE50_9PSEU|nr:response regulator transcription factor [Amycolatopsis acididurans]NKQ57724.1 response regulator transcription factor [Amycolatopsis acididurans]